jgi:phosphate transport system substrate-binding protein
MFKKLFVGFALLALAVTGVACASPTPEVKTVVETKVVEKVVTVTPAPAQPTAAPKVADLTGQIKIDGSSTVFPISEAVGEEFGKKFPKVKVPVGISGTGGGFKKFCSDSQADWTDISDASRPIKQSEIDQCKKVGVEYIELPVAFDGLSVVVNPKNTWAQCLTVAELKKMWEPEAQGKITNWNQIRASFPDKPLKLYGPGTDSGTFDYFTEAINGKEKASRGDYTPSEDDNVLVQGVGDPKNDGALGYFGVAYYEANADKLKLVAVDKKGDGNCVLPTFDNVKTGKYDPLSRPLFIYVNKKAADRPEVKEFVNFYIVNAPKLVKEVGYIPLPDDVYKLVAERFAKGVTGSMYAGKSPEPGVTLDVLLKK